ncbi:MAG TPA: MoaD/ThiS family protein, partial [Gaiellaceae bacterium]|nr:MoaD/ThiS family protein [Gaiellaceae bacterium]
MTVRLFAGLRERAGWSRREIEAATVADVWPALEIGDEPAGLLYAVNKEYAERDRALEPGDEVALIPPVSGGAFLLSDEPLSLDHVVEEVRSDEAGAIATFTGTTRVHSRGRTVTHL